MLPPHTDYLYAHIAQDREFWNHHGDGIKSAHGLNFVADSCSKEVMINNVLVLECR